MRATSVVLDSNVFASDFLLVGLPFRLLRAMSYNAHLNVIVPALVVEEVVATHDRAVRKVVFDGQQLQKRASRLGLSVDSQPTAKADYRAVLLTLFDETFSFSIADWPAVSHASLVERSVSRTPPFDEKGGGYRDSLIWATVLELAEMGHRIALVSRDNAFAGDDDALHPRLAGDVEGFEGSVELVRDLGEWLQGQVPWGSGDLESAYRESQDDEIYRYISEFDLLEGMEPDQYDLGLPEGTQSVLVQDVEWNGSLKRVGSRTGPDGLVLVEYEVGMVVDVEAQMPSKLAAHLAWGQVFEDGFGSARVTGRVGFRARFSVLFDSHGYYVGLQEFLYGEGQGVSPAAILPIPGQLSLLDY